MTIHVAQARRPKFALKHRIALAREMKGIEQVELAALLGVNRTTVSNWERGFSKPSRPVIMALALALDVDVDWLETGAEAIPPAPGGGTMFVGPHALRPAALAQSAERFTRNE